MRSMSHLSTAQLEAGLGEITAAPTDAGTLQLIVRRPASLQREVLESGELRLDVGLAGDNWIERPSRDMADGSPNPNKQLNIMGWRVALLVADGDAERVPLAGDQLFIDLDLSADNLPAGTRLAIGDAVIEITDSPHNGCAKFTERFGLDAMHFVNNPEGKQMKLRGVCAKVVQGGAVRQGDRVSKVR
jgi:hypothetical protein